jgi:hypothetical protein
MEASDLGFGVFRVPFRRMRGFTAAFGSIASGHEMMDISDTGVLHLFSFRLWRDLATFVSLASGHIMMEAFDLGLFVVRGSFRRMRRSWPFVLMATEAEADLCGSIFLFRRFSFRLIRVRSTLKLVSTSSGIEETVMELSDFGFFFRFSFCRMYKGFLITFSLANGNVPIAFAILVVLDGTTIFERQTVDSY